MIRGIYHEDEEDPAWRRVPTFATKVRAMMWSGAVQCALGCVLTTCVAQEEAEAFTKKNISNTCTNPKYSQCCHVFTTLCDWDQVQSLLLPKLEEYRRKFPVRPPSPIDVERNVFAKHQGVVDNVLLRADLPFHKRTTEESTLNTLRYCFFHMRCGIFVMIRRRKVVMFVPFVNHHYRNTWSKFLTIDHGNTLDSYYGVKQRSVFGSGCKCMHDIVTLAACCCTAQAKSPRRHPPRHCHVVGQRKHHLQRRVRRFLGRHVSDPVEGDAANVLRRARCPGL